MSYTDYEMKVCELEEQVGELEKENENLKSRISPSGETFQEYWDGDRNNDFDWNDVGCSCYTLCVACDDTVKALDKRIWEYRQTEVNKLKAEIESLKRGAQYDEKRANSLKKYEGK